MSNIVPADFAEPFRALVGQNEVLYATLETDWDEWGIGGSQRLTVLIRINTDHPITPDKLGHIGNGVYFTSMTTTMEFDGEVADELVFERSLYQCNRHEPCETVSEPPQLDEIADSQYDIRIIGL